MPRLPACCMDFDIKLEHLLFPDRLPAEGWEFYSAHGLDRMTLQEVQSRSRDMGNGLVKIQHRCDQLLDNGDCRIYDTRPEICRLFDCTSRRDCDCQGRGRVAIVPLEEIGMTSRG